MEQDYSIFYTSGSQFLSEDSLLMSTIVGQDSELYLIDLMLRGVFSPSSDRDLAH